MGGFAWVTLATNDPYSLGALVLAHSLKQVGTKHDIAILITPGVTPAMREKLANVFSFVQEVNVLDSQDQANLALLARPELGITFTKLHCWRLTQYDKCVFVDADALVVRNCDELFEREELSAAPDVGWPDCFNSGVFVFKPSQQTFASLTAFAVSKGSFDGGDQGLLNLYFSDWAHKDISKHLPFIYNMCSTASYSYLPAYKQFGADVRIIHFIGSTKPWLQYFDTQTSQVHPTSGLGHLQSLLQQWWNIFCEHVHPQLSSDMAGIAGALANITLGEPRTSEQDAYEEHMRKQSWEQGQIDYMGRDSFDNIWKKICTTLSTPFENEPAPTENLSSEQTNEAAAKFSSSSTQSAAELPSTAEESGAISPTMLALSPPLMKLAIKEAGEKTIKPSRKSREIEEPQTPTVIPLGPPPSLQAQAEAAVPIQVAESVLEADIKESVSEDIKPVTEEAISSISAPVQESISAIVEAPLEPPVPVRSQPVEASVVSQANGSSVLEAELAVDEEGICPLKARVELLSSPKPLGVDGNQVGTDFKASGTSSAPPLQIPATPKVIEATPPTSPPLDPPGDSKLVGDEPKTPKKVVKKSVKKSGSPEEKEGGALDDGKKTKKVVKKVGSSSSAVEAKKDDGAEAAGSPLDKPKKIVKVKKTTKPSQTLETDTSVPETPPPVASETPIPPKRKVKSVTAKTTTKKSESES